MLFPDWMVSSINKYPNGANIILTDILVDIYSFLYENDKVRQVGESFVFKENIL